MNDLNGKIALITGATSGIGEASALRFSDAGATVIVTGRSEKRGRVIASNCCKRGGRAEFIELDVTNDKSINRIYDYINNKYGRLDILFNNAGIFPVAPQFENLSREFCSNVYETNLNGMMMITKVFLSMLCKAHGNILNTASVAGMEEFNSGAQYAYSVSKSGVIKFTQLLAKKYGSEIRVNCICPGVIRTPIFKHLDEDRYKTFIPMGRIGEPEDVASVANFLVSDDASYINGCVLTIDGGQSL